MISMMMIIIALLVVSDQLIKAVMLLWLKPMGSFMLVKGFLQFYYVENTGAAFSMLSGEFGRRFFIIFTVIAIAAGLYLLISGRLKSPVLKISAVLIISGGLGNLIDRIFRGSVIDYIEPLFVNFAVFNFADCLVTVGAAILIVYLIYDLVKSVRKSDKASGGEG